MEITTKVANTVFVLGKGAARKNWSFLQKSDFFRSGEKARKSPA
jgi:hypothetical protein